MHRKRIAHLLVWSTVGVVVLLSFGLVLTVARRDYQIGSYAELFRLQNLPAAAFGTVAVAIPVLVVLALPLAFLVRRVVRPDRRRQQGQCTACGYPLRAAACCSECGTPVERA